jgi:V-type ATPase 116kDa subunit family
MKSGSFLSIFIGFPVWVASTVGVIMLMDMLECFLHTLRLHWYAALTQGRVHEQVLQGRWLQVRSTQLPQLPRNCTRGLINWIRYL